MAKILVVDDTDIVLFATEQTLIRCGHVVSIASNGVEALELWDSTFDLLLTDRDMPQMGGRELIRCLIGHGETRPIILMTGDHQLYEREVLSWGAAALLYKPFELNKLISIIDRLLSPT